MRARCSLVVNGRTVRVSTGDTPLEAALVDGLIAPVPALHGVHGLGQGAGPAGRRVPVRHGRNGGAVEQGPAGPEIQLPEAAAAPVPRKTTFAGSLTQIRRLGPGVVEVVATLTLRPSFEPGHLCEAAFAGLPAMTLGPTLRVDGSAEINEAVFHLPRDPEGGLVDGLAPGQAVRLRGPVGRGQYRPGGGRLVLVAAGTGFAPIWAIARAARYVEPAREMALAIGARDALDLYMRESLDWLRGTGVSRIVLCADRGRQRPPDVRPGPLGAHLPGLRATDVVHVAGDLSTVGAVQVLAAAVGARCHPIVVG